MIARLCDRVPPQSLESEQAVLGCCLLVPLAIDETTEVMRPTDFYRDAHRVVYEVICEIADRNDPVDLLSVTEQLRSHGVLENIGGPGYLIQLLNAIPAASNVSYYAEVVARKAQRRRLIDAANRIAAMAQDEDHDDEKLLADCGKALDEAGSPVGPQDYRHIRAIVNDVFTEFEEAYERNGAMNGVPTGLPELDRETNGWQNGDLIFLGARPGVGKSAIAINTFAGAALANGKNVVVFSLEMKDRQVVRRLISSAKKVSLTQIRRGQLSDQDWRKIGEGCAQLSEMPIIIDDHEDLTASQIRAKLRRISRTEWKPDLVIIDYLMLLGSEHQRDKEYQRVDDAAKAIKRIAKEFDIPVILVTQLNRDIERRTVVRPSLADLKEAGESHADMVLFLFRDPNPPESDEVTKIWLSIAKHRNGALGDIPLAYHGEWTRFDQMEIPPDAPGAKPGTGRTCRAYPTSSSTAQTPALPYKDNDEDSPVISSSGNGTRH